MWGRLSLLVSTIVQELVDFCLGNMFTLDSWLEKSYAHVIFEDHHEQIIIW